MHSTNENTVYSYTLMFHKLERNAYKILQQPPSLGTYVGLVKGGNLLSYCARKGVFGAFQCRSIRVR